MKEEAVPALDPFNSKQSSFFELSMLIHPAFSSRRLSRLTILSRER